MKEEERCLYIYFCSDGFSTLSQDVIEGIENGGWKDRTIRFRVGEEDDLRKCFGEGEE